MGLLRQHKGLNYLDICTKGITMSDPTEYDPNSKDITDDPDFPAPKCGVCGIPWVTHIGEVTDMVNKETP